MKFSLTTLSLLLSASSNIFVRGDKKMYKGKITVTNMAPVNGTCLTPTWIGIHDGTFDIYNRDEAVSAELERVVEDGDMTMWMEKFAMAPGYVYQNVVGAGMDKEMGKRHGLRVLAEEGEGTTGPICGGQSSILTINELQIKPGDIHYISYVAMVLPSNDAWIANGDPKAYEIFDADGMFVPVEIMDMGTDILDAGSEVNDEIPENTPFLGQTVPNTGEVENGVVTAHAGFMAAGQGGILDMPKFVNADFTAPDYMVMKLTVDLNMIDEDTPTAAPVGGGDMTSAAALVSSLLVTLGSAMVVGVALF